MKTTHTPGPWRIGQVHVDDANGFRVAAVTYREEQAANARLIASAPELMAVCERLVNDFPENKYDCTGIHALYAAARAAIAKAKGEL